MIAVQAGQAEFLGVFRERDGVATLGRGAADLIGHELRIPQRHDREGDETTGIRSGPLVDVPVVVGANAVEGEILILRAQEKLTAEVDERREVERTENSVGVHIANALVHVVTTRAHVLVAQRIESALPYPAASVALLDGLTEVTGIEVAAADLRAAVGPQRQRIDASIADNADHATMLRQLEEMYDASTDGEVSPGPAFEMRSGDELADEIQQFLRNQD